jgi:hypothetical protein
MYLFLTLASIFFVSETSCNNVYRTSCITSQSSYKAGFGDHLLLLLKTLWISRKYGIRYVYSENYWLNELTINDEIQSKKFYPKICIPLNERDIRLIRPHTFIEMPYLFQIGEYTNTVDLHDWHEIRGDYNFIDFFRKKTTLKNPTKFNLIYPPKDIPSVAIHVRLYEAAWGQLFSRQILNDPDSRFKILEKNDPLGVYADKAFPLKFPPLQYYIDSIKYLIDNFIVEDSVYIYIFTDHPCPEIVVNEIKKHVFSEKEIIFDCRRSINYGKNQKNRTYSDFYSLLNFDYLIRSGHSNFSQLAQILKDYKAVIFSTGYRWENDFLRMTNIHVEVNNRLFKLI